METHTINPFANQLTASFIKDCQRTHTQWDNKHEPPELMLHSVHTFVDVKRAVLIVKSQQSPGLTFMDIAKTLVPTKQKIQRALFIDR
jgi:hypothetical protein